MRDALDRAARGAVDTIKRDEKATDRSTGLELVRNAVLAVNELNAPCDHGLIETDEREDLCAVFLRAGALRGLHGAHEDIMVQWREW